MKLAAGRNSIWKKTLLSNFTILTFFQFVAGERNR
jgi:hypothetical protein